MKLFKVDSGLIESGDWVGDIPGFPGIRFKVRGAGNADYRMLQGKLIREIPRERRPAGIISPADEDRINGQLMLKTIVLDIEGITENDEVTPIKYTEELGTKLFLDPDYREWRAAAEYCASLIANRREDEEAQAIKN